MFGHERAGFEQHEMEALRQKVSVWFGDETALSLETAPQLRARLKRLAPDEVPFLQVRGTRYLVSFFPWHFERNGVLSSR